MDWRSREKDPEFLKRRLRRMERADEFTNRQNTEPDKLLRQLNSPAINELLDLLSLGSGPPKISFTTEGVGGGTRGWYKPFHHTMGLEKGIAGDIYNFAPEEHYMQRGQNTSTHELVHALDRNMMFHATSNPLSLFTDAYTKLKPSTLNTPGFQEKRNTNKDMYDAYRYSSDEARAHAVADSYYPKGAPDDLKNAPRHSNATLATEFEILKDLYKRSFKGQQK